MLVDNKDQVRTSRNQVTRTSEVQECEVMGSGGLGGHVAGELIACD